MSAADLGAPLTIKYDADGAGFDAIVRVGGGAVARRVPRNYSNFLQHAPDLLKALREAERMVDAGYRNNPTPDDFDALNRIRAAIARAT